MSTVGLALIVRDEEKRLPRLLKSVIGVFDQIVLVDTGSTDGTIQVAEEWANAYNENLEVHHFEWINDFSAARNYADSLLTTDWKVWADADDEIVGANRIREVVENGPPNVVSYICGYDYAQHPDTGDCVCHLKRERIVKAGASTWMGRVHEAQIVNGAVTFVPDEILHWKHQKVIDDVDVIDATRSNERNLTILKEWIKDEPTNGRVLAYLGTESAVRGEHEVAIEWYEKYLDLETQWNEERAQVHRKYAASLMALGHPRYAIRTALDALHVLPEWPDSHLTLAEAYLQIGEPQKAAVWARQVIGAGVPNTLLIINPLDYTFTARRVLAEALAATGDYQGAMEVANEALTYFPDGHLIAAMKGWQGILKRERTAETYVMAFQQLVNHDEQIKARDLLRCVPHFAIDHPRIVEAREFINTRLRWVDDPRGVIDHYGSGGDKPEEGVPDDQIDDVATRIPRMQFLAESLKEMA